MAVRAARPVLERPHGRSHAGSRPGGANIVNRNKNTPLGDLIDPIATEIKEPSNTKWADGRLDVGRNTVERAGGWLTEKVEAAAGSGAGSGEADHGNFMALEALALGILGKRSRSVGPPSRSRSRRRPCGSRSGRSDRASRWQAQGDESGLGSEAAPGRPLGLPRWDGGTATDAASRAVGLPVAGVLALIARLRGGKAVHPHGVSYSAEFCIDGSGAASRDSRLLGQRGEWPAIVRFSRSIGLPRPLPDLLGVSIRILDAYGEGRHQDFLMVSIRRPARAPPHLPASGRCPAAPLQLIASLSRRGSVIPDWRASRPRLPAPERTR